MKKLFLTIYFILLPWALFAADALKDAVTKGIHDVSLSLVQAIIPILAILIGLILNKLLEKIKIGIIRNLVRKWILAAYQKYASGDHATKYQEVAEKIHAKFPYLATEEIKDLIEEAVAQVKIDIGKPLNGPEK